MNSKHTASVDLDKLRQSLTSYLDNFAKLRPFPNSDRRSISRTCA